SGRFFGSWFRAFKGWPGGLRLGEVVKLVQLGLEQLLVGEPGLVLRNQGRRYCPAQGVLDYLVGFGGAEQHADRRALMRLAHVPVEGLQIELQLTEVSGLELLDLQLEGDQAIERPVEEQ